jgi:hypothetical protein
LEAGKVVYNVVCIVAPKEKKPISDNGLLEPIVKNSHLIRSCKAPIFLPLLLGV